ncbi:MAG: hypothetical protein WDN28_00110 [Chthoniobacter sp.]
MKLYGVYDGPIGLFSHNNQPDLGLAFQQSKAGELGFAFGYAWQTPEGPAHRSHAEVVWSEADIPITPVVPSTSKQVKQRQKTLIVTLALTRMRLPMPKHPSLVARG